MDLPQTVGETESEPIQAAQYYANLANEVAMNGMLKCVAKKVMKAALQGRLSVKVGYLPLVIVDHLTRRGFTYIEDQNDPNNSFLHF